METINLTKEEEQNLRHFVYSAEKGEKDQVSSLFSSNLSRFRIASTHSAYVEDWETTKVDMERNIKLHNLPPNTSEAFYRALIIETEKIVDKKLKMVQMMFESQFGESIFNYLDENGKKKKFLGLF